MPKPHGSAFFTRRRCVFCGYIVNDTERFSWEHKHQTFQVRFGATLGGHRGGIEYTEIEDAEFDPIMLAQLRRVARAYGFRLVRIRTPEA